MTPVPFSSPLSPPCEGGVGGGDAGALKVETDSSRLARVMRKDSEEESVGSACDWSCRDHPSYPPFARGGKTVTRLRNGGKTAQRNREESAACARPTFQQPSTRQGIGLSDRGDLGLAGACHAAGPSEPPCILHSQGGTGISPTIRGGSGRAS